jgi:hypothetical protein
LRFSGGVRIKPQKHSKIAGATTLSWQSIQALARARMRRSAGSNTPARCLAAR